jgi:ankyrin repeat protein
MGQQAVKDRWNENWKSERNSDKRLLPTLTKTAAADFKTPGAAVAMRKVLQQASPVRPLSEPGRLPLGLDLGPISSTLGNHLLHVRCSSETSATSQAIYRFLDSSELSRQVVVYFQFDRYDHRFNNVAAMLTTTLASFYHNEIRSEKAAIDSRMDLTLCERGSDIDMFGFWCFFILKYGGRDVILVLDGLDQCDDSVQWFLANIVRSLKYTENFLKLIITTTKGRDDHIVSRLSGVPADIYEVISDDSDLLVEPVAPLVTLLEVAMVLREAPSYAPYEAQIKDLLCRCSKDLCLWKMVAKWLRSPKDAVGDKFGELTKTAQITPGIIFEAILQSVPADQHKWVSILISWATFALRPVRLHELCVVSHMASGHDIRQTCILTDAVATKRLAEIEAYLGGFLTVHGEDVRFGHPSLQGWLESTAGVSLPTGNWYQDKTKRQRHQDILESCLDYHRIFEIEHPSEVAQSYQLPYAIEQWTYHYQQVMSEGQDEASSLESSIPSILSQQPALKRWVAAYNELAHPFAPIDETFKSILPVAAYFGMGTWIENFEGDPEENGLAFVQASKRGHETFVRRLLKESKYTPSIDDPFLQHATRAAAYFAHHGVLQEILPLLPKKLETSQPWLDQLLCRASYLGWVDVVEALLSMGVSVNPPAVRGGPTPLHLAGRMAQVEAMKILLEAGASTSSVASQSGETPLHVAAAHGSVEVIELLFKGGADIGVQDSSGYTPLQGACLKGHHAVVELLAAHKSTEEDMVEGYNPLTDQHDDPPLMIAIEKGYPKIAEVLLRHGSNPDIEDEYGTALLQSVQFERLEIVQLLLGRNADPNKVRPKTIPAIVEAAARENLEMIELLLKHGADPEKKELPGASSGFQRTALQLAVQDGLTKTVKLLLDRGANPDAADGDGWTAIWTAAASENVEIARYLAQAGADLRGVCGGLNHTPLHAGVRNAELVRVLLEYGADVSQESDSGTPIDLAATENYAESLGLMLADRRSKPDLKSDKLAKAFRTSIREGYVEVASLLLEAGMDVNSKMLNGDPVLVAALEGGNAEMVDTLLQYHPDLTVESPSGGGMLHCITTKTPKESIKRLVNAGARLDLLNNKQETALSRAARHSTPEVVDYLESKYPKAKNIVGMRGTPLNIACREGTLGNVKALVELGSDVNSPGSWFSGTPLVSVCFRSGNDDEKDVMIQYLLDNGAKTNTRGGMLAYPLNTAGLRTSSSIIKLLLRNEADTDVQDSMGRRPVHFASYNSVEALDALAPVDAAYGEKDYSGRVALHYAAASGQLQLLKSVWARSQLAGIPIDVRDNDDWTPLLWAARSAQIWGPSRESEETHDEVVAWLLDKGANVEASGRALNKEWIPYEVAAYEQGSPSFLRKLGQKLDAPKRRRMRAKKGDLGFGLYCDFCLMVSQSTVSSYSY